MKKVVLSCVFSAISFANVFGMIPPEEKSAVSEKSPVSSQLLFAPEDMAAVQAFSDFLKENADEEFAEIEDELKDLFGKLKTPLKHLQASEINEENNEILFKALAPLFYNLLEKEKTFEYVSFVGCWTREGVISSLLH